MKPAATLLATAFMAGVGIAFGGAFIALTFDLPPFDPPEELDWPPPYSALDDDESGLDIDVLALTGPPPPDPPGRPEVVSAGWVMPDGPFRGAIVNNQTFIGEYLTKPEGIPWLPPDPEDPPLSITKSQIPQTNPEGPNP